MEIVESGRKSHIDVKIACDISNQDYSNSFFLRLVSKGKRFEKVDFKYTIFDTCYMRNCVFDSCDFTGCRFTGGNLYGSSFIGCKFDYVYFERTIIDDEILNVGCPSVENLKLKFARTLRQNYQQLGDSKSVNKAIKVELDATEVYLKKSWRSNESYYRKKFSGPKRILKYFEWARFRILDIVWGNGESAWKLLRSIAITLLLMTICDAIYFKDVTNLTNYWYSFWEMSPIFLGIKSPSNYNSLYLTFITCIRLIAIGFFLSILIKRFNRR
jgi:hypothetical protein